MGTVGTGTWNASTITVAKGGTGATNITDAKTNLQVPLSNNYLLNGGFDIWQKGDVVSQGTKCGADQWYFYYYYAMSQRRITSGVPSSSSNAMRVQSDANGNLAVGVMQALETKMAANLWGKKVTFSVKLRRASTMTQPITLLVYKHATVDQSPASGTWTNINSVSIPNATIPTGTTSSDWYTASLTVDIPSDGTANTLWFEVRASGGMDNGVYYEIAEAQVEHGAVATPFRRNSPNFQAEFAACQRYYWRFTQVDNYYMFNSATCWSSGGEMIVNVSLPVTQRITGTQSMTNISSIYWLGNGTNLTGATGPSYRPTKEAFVLVCTVPSQTATNTWAFRPVVGSYLESNAEL